MVHGVDECRRKAAEAERSAQKASSELERRTFQKIARNWRELIRFLERPSEDLSLPAMEALADGDGPLGRV